MAIHELGAMWKWSWYNLSLACCPGIFLELRKTMKNLRQPVCGQRRLFDFPLEISDQEFSFRFRNKDAE
jgi:hypothetical protein